MVHFYVQNNLVIVLKILSWNLGYMMMIEKTKDI